MFGKPPQQSNGATPPQKPSAAEVARIQGGGLVQLIVTSLVPLNYYLFLNDQSVAQSDVESFSLSIEAPNDSSFGDTIVRCTLSRYVRTVTGEQTQQRTELFPCTLEIIALGRRISITCLNSDSLDGLWISLGLKADGTSAELSGVRSVRFLLTEGILDAKLTWVDGETEDLLPQA